MTSVQTLMHRARGRYHFYQQLHLHLNLDYTKCKRRHSLVPS